MIEEIRLAWTDRLRDHTNPQGIKRLWLNEPAPVYDVWGHLCEVAANAENGPVTRDYAFNGYRTQDGKLHVRYPPDEVLKWAGIDREAGPSSDIVLHLAARNDNESNFPFMAEEIDQYLG